jgi:hypothetical protein
VPDTTNASVVYVCQFAAPPQHYFLLRIDPPDNGRFVWCGRSMGWRPLETTSSVFLKRFPTLEAAEEASDKYIKLPVQGE